MNNIECCAEITERRVEVLIVDHEDQVSHWPEILEDMSCCSVVIAGEEVCHRLSEGAVAAILLDASHSGTEARALVTSFMNYGAEYRVPVLLLVNGRERADWYRIGLPGYVDCVDASLGSEGLRAKVSFFIELSLRADQERQRADELREAAKCDRVELLSVVSHELRSPLTALKLRLDAVLTDELTPRLRKNAEHAVRQVGRIDRILDNLLDHSRIVAGRLALKFEPVELVTLVRDVVGRMHSDVVGCGSTIELAGAAEARGSWDRVRLERVVGNLLSNALSFGNGEPVVVRIQECKAGVSLAIEDRGIGITDEQIERCFEQLDLTVTRREHGGLGTGLFVVREIVRLHGGTLQIVSRANGGTAVVVTLPTHRKEAQSFG